MLSCCLLFFILQFYFGFTHLFFILQKFRISLDNANKVNLILICMMSKLVHLQENAVSEVRRAHIALKVVTQLYYAVRKTIEARVYYRL